MIRGTINPGSVYVTLGDSFAGSPSPVVSENADIGDPALDDLHYEGWRKEIEKIYGVRTFDTGATRDTDEGKLDYEGFLSPLTLRRYAEYMDAHRIQSDGTLRPSDNWSAGIPLDAYMKSGWRHFMDVWTEHRGISTEAGLEESLCACLFNLSGYLHELVKARTEIHA